jgi:carboxypeptidase C (cathepsin A)
LAAYTGVDERWVERANDRLTGNRFAKELLRDQRRTVGRFDGRYTGIDGDAAGETVGYDPSFRVVQGRYTAAFNHYVRAELEFESDLVYEVLTNVQPWDFGDGATNRYLDVADTLQSSMSKNRDLRVFLGSGYYDLATPYFAAEWSLDHMGLDASLFPNITMARYEAGHMMYTHDPSLEALGADLRAFIGV